MIVESTNKWTVFCVKVTEEDIIVQIVSTISTWNWKFITQGTAEFTLLWSSPAVTDTVYDRISLGDDEKMLNVDKVG